MKKIEMKKIIFAMAVVAAAASTHASYLYWQIGSDDIAAANTASGQTVQGVRIYALNNTTGEQTFLKLGYADSGTDSFKYVDGTDGGANSYAVSAPVGGPLLADVTSFASGDYSFYVELINNDVAAWKSNLSSAYGTADFAGQLVSSGTDDPITYTGLSDKGFIGNDLSPVSMAVWHGGAAYSSVPEPTSAMLVLFGLAGLALRRRTV